MTEQPKKIIAITACPTGIAHTYMAAEKLTEAAEARGWEMRVETHGSIGVEGAFTAAEIEAADAVVIAADKQVDLSRFAGKPLVKSKVADGIHKPGELMDRALAAPPHQGTGSSAPTESSGGVGGDIYKALMNGVSHMIPFVVTGGLLIAVALSLGGDPTPTGLVVPEDSFWNTILQIGALGFSVMVAVLSAYIAMAIADRPGLAPGFITGLIAVNGALYNSEANAGFIGGILTGFLSGYVALGIKKIKVPKVVAPIMPIIVIPVATTLIVGLAFIFLLGGPIAAVFTSLTTTLEGMTGTSTVVLGLVLGGMIGFDMGGPINKTAFLFAGGLIASGNAVPMGMVAVAIGIPPIGMGLASIVRPNIFTESERESGKAALFMGFFGITEGAIPFAAARPLQVIPANVIGSAVGAAVAGLFATSDNVMHGGVIVALLGAVDPVLSYLFAIAVGVAVTAGIAIVTIRPRHDDPAPEAPAAVSLAASPSGTSSDSGGTGGTGGTATMTAPAEAPAKASISEYLSAETVVLNPIATSRDELIRELAQTGIATGQISDVDEVVRAALAREAQGSTGVGMGIAIPHAKTDGAARPFIAFARNSNGIDWSSDDGELAKLFFLISVPSAAAGTEHLRILQGLSRALIKDDFRTALFNASSEQEVVELVENATT